MSIETLSPNRTRPLPDLLGRAVLRAVLSVFGPVAAIPLRYAKAIAGRRTRYRSEASELNDRMRRDIGLPPAEPPPHWSDFK